MSTDKITTEEISILQLSDSFFPTGMYATSNGLEALFYAKKIKHPNELRNIIKVYLEHQIGPTDCAALGNSYEYVKKNDLKGVIEVDRITFSMKLVQEIRETSTRAGTQLLKCLSYFIADNEMLNKYLQSIKNLQAYGVYPVALAIASASLNISKRRAGLMMVYAFLVSMVGAALRLGMLQHFDGQKIIHELKPDIVEIVNDNIDRPITGMWQFAPGIDIFQMAHERMPSKMFIT
ncbi:MAG TPA: urease accessory UreF family protein [Nitrososphaeraceae archaeon]|nr:urease accessory UreF family protein [Nitrososphaeraceae archaeon]